MTAAAAASGVLHVSNFHRANDSCRKPPCGSPRGFPRRFVACKIRGNAAAATSAEFGILLRSCIDARALERGRELHARIRQAGFARNRDLLPGLVKLYTLCGQIQEARDLFDESPNRDADIYLWTSMACAYLENGFPGEALGVFGDMLGRGVKPDTVTLTALLKASARLDSGHLAAQLHLFAIKLGHASQLSVINALVHVYGSLGDVGAARRIFERGGAARDVISWTSIIRACSLAGHHFESLQLFSRMQSEGSVRPNAFTVVSVLPSCSFYSCLRKGQAIHAYVLRNGLERSLIVGSALVSMYARCGEPDPAYLVFNSHEEQNVILWTSTIESFAVNGRFDEAFDLFRAMQERGVTPNSVTLLVVLSACSHGGFVTEGREIFETMGDKFSLRPGVEHHACVVDMLGRAGRLDEAEEFMERMDVRPTASMLGSLLGACRAQRKLELGERLAPKLFELEPGNAANYVMLSNLYALVGRWDDVGRIRGRMKAEGLSKDAGCSWIEVKHKIYIFGAHDRSHLESASIYKMLEKLTSDMIRRTGYVPSTSCVLLDAEDEDEKRALLCGHSERLAIAFGLLRAPPSAPIRITKNLRVCEDCHEAIKHISRLIPRKLVIRDTTRFHHFSGGSCSCGDYW